jgi:hypothetical protein
LLESPVVAGTPVRRSWRDVVWGLYSPYNTVVKKYGCAAGSGASPGSSLRRHHVERQCTPDNKVSVTVADEDRRCGSLSGTPVASDGREPVEEASLDPDLLF